MSRQAGKQEQRLEHYGYSGTIDNLANDNGKEASILLHSCHIIQTIIMSSQLAKTFCQPPACNSESKISGTGKKNHKSVNKPLAMWVILRLHSTISRLSLI